MNLPFSRDVLYPSTRRVRKVQIGDVYRLVSVQAMPDETNLYMLSGTGYQQICLVSLDDGQRWEDPIECINSPSHYDIRQKDLELLFDMGTFEYVCHIEDLVAMSGV